MIVIAGTIRIKPETRERAMEVAARMAEATLAEPGCHQYRFATSINDPDEIVLFEEWEDQAALDAHFASAHMVAFNEAVGEFVAGMGEFTRYEVSSVAPLFG